MKPIKGMIKKYLAFNKVQLLTQTIQWNDKTYSKRILSKT